MSKQSVGSRSLSRRSFSRRVTCKRKKPAKEPCRAKCTRGIKGTWIASNILLVMVGMALFVLLALTRFHTDAFDYANELLNEQRKSDLKMNQVYISFYLLMCAGALCTPTGIIGLVAIRRHSLCALLVSMALIALVIGSEVGASVMAGLKRDTMKSWITEGVEESMKGYHLNSTSDTKRTRIDKLQNELSCCGCRKGRADYGQETNGSAPDSCATFQDACCEKVWVAVSKRLHIIAGVVVGSLLIGVVAGIFALPMIHIVLYKEIYRGPITFILDRRLEKERELKTRLSKNPAAGIPSPSAIVGKADNTPRKSNRRG